MTTCSLHFDPLRWVGDPVDVVTGALADDHRDFTLPGPWPLTWLRRYDTGSLDRRGAFGHGHSLALDASVRWVVDGLLDDLGDLFAFADDGANLLPCGPRTAEVRGQQIFVRDPGGDTHVFSGGAPDRPAHLTRIIRGAHAFDLQRDDAGRLVRVDDPVGARSLRITHRDDRIFDVQLVRPGAPTLALMRYAYSDAGDLVAALDHYGHRATFTYDAQHRMVARTDRRGYRFEYTYDDHGRCICARGHDDVQSVRLRYLPEARATVVTRADGGEWMYRYDEVGSITEILDPYGGARRFTHDPDGRLATETDPGGAPRSLIHAADGRRIAWRTAAGGLRPLTCPSGPLPHRTPATACAYELGEFVAVITARAPIASPGLRPLFLHGASNFSRLFPERDPRADCRRDPLGLLLAEERTDATPRRWFYDANGQFRRYLDHLGRQFAFEHTSWNHRTSATDPLGRTIAYAYSPTEQLVAVTDPAGNHHTYDYDLRDALVAVHHAGHLVETYTHDPAGNLVAKHDARGALLVRYAYGPDNLPVSRVLADGEEHRTTYDLYGRAVRREDDRHTLEFAYNPDGRRRLDRCNGRGVTHRFARGVLVETTILDRFVVRYRRPAPDVLEIEDPLGGRHTLEFGDGGAVTRHLACGVTELLHYDSAGRCLGKHLHLAEPRKPVWRRAFSLDAEGDLAAVDDSERGRHSFTYDGARQLASVTHPAGTDTYQYDRAGNLLSAPHLHATTIAAGNRLTACNSGEFTYDHRNNVATWTRDGRVRTFHRDALDRLRRIDGLDAPWSADYDPLGRRTRKTYGEHTTEYVWDTDRLAAELGPGDRLRIYVYVDDFAIVPFLCIDYPARDADPADGQPHYLVTDQRGAPVAALDAAGQRVWSADLAPYGLADTSGPLGLHLRFPGHLHDPETGLHYNRFRYYSPELGRYLEEDPAGVGGGLNLYAYTTNPLTQVDTRGLGCGDEDTPPKDKDEDGPKKKKPTDDEQGDSTTPKELSNSEHAKLLRANMKANPPGLKPPPYKNSAHHIVMSTSKDMADVRDHLAKHGVDINDWHNGVFLPFDKDTAAKHNTTAPEHQSIHSDKYKEAVRDRVMSAETKQEIQSTLRDIAREIENGTFPP